MYKPEFFPLVEQEQPAHQKDVFSEICEQMRVKHPEAARVMLDYDTLLPKTEKMLNKYNQYLILDETKTANILKLQEAKKSAVLFKQLVDCLKEFINCTFIDKDNQKKMNELAIKFLCQPKNDPISIKNKFIGKILSQLKTNTGFDYLKSEKIEDFCKKNKITCNENSRLAIRKINDALNNVNSVATIKQEQSVVAPPENYKSVQECFQLMISGLSNTHQSTEQWIPYATNLFKECLLQNIYNFHNKNANLQTELTAIAEYEALLHTICDKTFFALLQDKKFKSSKLFSAYKNNPSIGYKDVITLIVDFILLPENRKALMKLLTELKILTESQEYDSSYLSLIIKKHLLDEKTKSVSKEKFMKFYSEKVNAIWDLPKKTQAILKIKEEYTGDLWLHAKVFEKLLESNFLEKIIACYNPPFTRLLKDVFEDLLNDLFKEYQPDELLTKFNRYTYMKQLNFSGMLRTIDTPNETISIARNRSSEPPESPVNTRAALSPKSKTG